jgi:hypothetical protein
VKSGRSYWFSAKRYGWGWTPSTWQGWLVLVGYVALVIWANILLGHGGDVLRRALVVGGLTLALVLICWVKGEPSRWRWGGH